MALNAGLSKEERISEIARRQPEPKRLERPTKITVVLVVTKSHR